MRVGIIGCGSIGIRHTKNLHTYTNCDIALYDSSSESANRCRSEVESFLVGNMRSRVMVVQNVDEMFTGLFPVDAVIICTPHSTHVEYALKAIRAGKHVLVEKPLATSLDQIPELEKALDSSLNVFSVAYNLRHHPVVAQAEFET